MKMQLSNYRDMAKVAELSADLESLLLSDQADGGIG